MLLHNEHNEHSQHAAMLQCDVPDVTQGLCLNTGRHENKHLPFLNCRSFSWLQVRNVPQLRVSGSGWKQQQQQQQRRALLRPP